MNPPMSRGRIVTLLSGAVGCALIATLVAYRVFRATEGETYCCCWDEIGILEDPRTLVAAPFAFLSAVIGFEFAVVTLRSAPLATAIPLVVGTTVCAAAATTFIAPLLSPLVALGTGVATMYWIRGRFR